MKIRKQSKKVTVQFKAVVDDKLKTKSITVYDTTLDELVKFFTESINK